MLELPAAYLILKSGAKPPMALVPVIFTTFIALIFRFIVLKKLVPSYSLKQYYIKTVLLCFALFILSFVPSFFIAKRMPTGFGWFILSSSISLALTGAVVYFLGINKIERQIVNNYILTKLKIIK